MARIPLSEFADKMNEILPRVIKEFARRQANELYKGKITLPQFLTLDFLSREGGCKMTTLAHFIGVTTAAMTGMVDRLIKYGYVLRVFDPEDRRIIKIKLTPKGQELIKKINRQRRQMIIDIFGQIPQAEREGYLKVLMHINDILTKDREKV